ncbi:MAG: TIR domain-containing protein [Proteobacteria bacterium]|nr:TIR domain-containing protein [Pseudomonadota bacterium]
MIRSFRYKAFISYSHTDRQWGRWLLRALETYRIPKHLVGRKTKMGRVPSRLLPIFRDRDELPATEDLSAEIQDVLANSEILIVVCSPVSAASPWVNKEIEEFRRYRGGANILWVIVGGEPNASTSKKFPSELECFPSALLSQKGKKAEPIAADLRKGGDGKRLGLLKLVAGMIGVGLDEIIRRDLQRRNRRVTAITLASVLGMVIMGGLTLTAIEAEREADLRRAEAEGLIEFMLTDLREKLEPVGRLDVLDTVGEEAVSYYAAQQLQDLSEDSLGRQARAFHLLGEIDNLQGDLEGAQVMFEAASEATADMLERNPNNQQRIFDHSQSVFWIAAIKWQRGNHQGAEKDLLEYKNLADQLVALDPENPDWQLEATYANSSLGTLYLANLDRPKDAYNIFKQLVSQRIDLLKSDPDNPKKSLDLANAYGWLADATKIAGTLTEAEEYRIEQLALLDQVLKQDQNNASAKSGKVTAELGLARIEMAQGEALFAVSRLRSLVLASEALVEHDETNTDWLKQAARHYLYLTEAFLLTEAQDEAEKSLARGQELIEAYQERTDLFFRQKVQLTYFYQLLNAKLSYVRSDMESVRRISQEIIENMTADFAKGLKASDATQVLAEAYLLGAVAALNIGNEAAATAELQTLVYLIEPRVEIEPPETLQILASAYFHLGEIEKAQSLDAHLKDRGYAKPNIYS